ncbi:MAG: hypothetical protein ABII10_02510 [Candidatus Paceibacterota bacterium]
MNKIISHPLVILILTVMAVLFILSLRKTAQKGQIATENVALLEKSIQDLADQIEEEKRLIDYSNTDLAKEKILHNELLLYKPGEYVIQIPDDEVLLIENANLEQKTPWEEWREELF